MYTPKKNYLVCVDSDGCVIDGMTIKHIKCFGPALVETFGLAEHENEVLTHWNDLNLYTKTRGINRFKGLSLALKEYKNRGYLTIEPSPLADWVENTKELSANALKKEMERQNISEGTEHVLSLALSWSNLVNQKVEKLKPEEKKVFEGVKSCFTALKKVADLAVVSSANKKAVEDEWEYNEILTYADIIMTQEEGTKADCLQLIKEAGYEGGHILMVGDSPGDVTCAKETGTLYYPLIVGAEPTSWKELEEKVLPSFINGSFATTQMEAHEKLYFEKL